MWRGYLKNEDGALVSKWFEDGGSRATTFIPAAMRLPLFCDRSPTRRMFTSGDELDFPGNLLFFNGVCGLQAAVCA